MVPYDINEIRRELYWAAFAWAAIGFDVLIDINDRPHGWYLWVCCFALLGSVFTALRAYRLAESAHH